VQEDEAKENSPGCSLSDDELNAVIVAMLDDEQPFNESLPSTSELIEMQPMLDSWQPSAQEAVLEEPLRFELGSQECNEMSEQMAVMIPLGEPRCATHSLRECSW
jgi:hypothetical protein